MEGGMAKSENASVATSIDNNSGASVSRVSDVQVSSSDKIVEEKKQVHGDAGTGGESSSDPVNIEKERLTDSQVMEVDELTFSDTLYQSYDAKNVTNKDGSLNIEKIESWGLPALNTSRLMEVTGYGTDAAREKLSRLLAAQNAGESYIETDPLKATPVEMITRKTLVANRFMQNRWWGCVVLKEIYYL